MLIFSFIESHVRSDESIDHDNVNQADDNVSTKTERHESKEDTKDANGMIYFNLIIINVVIYTKYVSINIQFQKKKLLQQQQFQYFSNSINAYLLYIFQKIVLQKDRNLLEFLRTIPKGV